MTQSKINKLSSEEAAALERLIVNAERSTGQGAKVANFLLAWWNADECGGFDPVQMWSCDQEIVDDMLVIFEFISRCPGYPDTLGYDKQFTKIVRDWRPQLQAQQTSA